MSTSLLHLFNTSWTAHRLSPFYHGKDTGSSVSLFSHDGAHLQTYATRLRDLLRGDVLRGVQVGLSTVSGADEGLAKAGPLLGVEWRILDTELDTMLEGEEPLSEEERRKFGFAERPGIFIVLRYENATYTAALLQSSRNSNSQIEGFTHFPLLLTRLPTPLRATFIDFLSSNFDCRATLLRLTPVFLLTRLEECLEALSNNRNSDFLISTLVKDAKMTLSFRPPIAPALRSLDINLPRAAITEFVAYGIKQQKSRRGPQPRDQQVANRLPSGPFITALSTYLSQTLSFSFSLRSKEYAITRITTAPFVLSTEGKAKIILESKYLESLSLKVTASSSNATEEEKTLSETMEASLSTKDVENRALALRIGLSVLNELLIKAVGSDSPLEQDRGQGNIG